MRAMKAKRCNIIVLFVQRLTKGKYIFFFRNKRYCKTNYRKKPNPDVCVCAFTAAVESYKWLLAIARRR